jgi:hypothetical protein
MENQKVVRVEDIKEGPLDGVSLETQGTYTKFERIESNRIIKNMNLCPVGIKASFELGVVSISDREHDIMLTVSMEDMTEIMAAAYEHAAFREKEGKICQEENRETTETSEPAPGVEQE